MKQRPTREEFKKRCREMYDGVSAMIASGEFSVNETLPSENALAERYGVSRCSARSVIGLLESQGLLSRVKGKGAIVSQGARVAPASGERRILAVTPSLLRLQEGPPAETQETPSLRATIIYDALETALNDAGISVAECEMAEAMALSPEGLAAKLEDEGAQGLILVYNGSAKLAEAARALAGKGVPVVSIAGSAEFPEAMSRVVYNNWQVGRLAAKRFLELGHSSMGFLGLCAGIPWVAERLGGFESSCVEGGGSCLKLLDETPSPPDSPSAWKACGRAFAKRLLRNPESLPKALFCANDDLAMSFIEEAEAAGFRIPEDFSTIGCDNDFAYHRRGLTSVKLNCAQAGRAASGLLAEFLAGRRKLAWPLTVKIAPTLIRRGSVLDAGASRTRLEPERL